MPILYLKFFKLMLYNNSFINHYHITTPVIMILPKATMCYSSLVNPTQKISCPVSDIADDSLWEFW